MPPIITFLVTTAMVYALVYLVSEQIQQNLYNQPVEGLWWRALLGSIPLGLLLMWYPSRLDEMVLTSPHWALLQIVVWFVVFWLVLGYHRGHAAVAGAVMYLVAGFLISLAMDSMASLFRG